MLKYGVTLLAAALVAGCATSAPKSRDEQFLDRLIAQKVISADTSRADRRGLVREAHRWCGALQDPGTTRAKAQRVLRDHAEIADLMRIGARYYCPNAGRRLLE